jgi:uncharacterized protein (TIGR03083 family)
MLDRDTYLRFLREDGRAFAKACDNSLNLPVAGCPGWVIRDLVIHVTEVHAFWNFIARTGIAGPENYVPPEVSDDANLMTGFRVGLDELVSALASTDAASPCWTWDGSHDIAWITRRMAQEMAVHTWDACMAIGDATPIDAVLASDGIDEFVHMMLRYPMPEAAAPVGSVHIHCTDVDGEWLIVPDGEQLIVSREHAKGICAIRGTAHDVLMVLWRRYTISDVEVIGDATVASRFVARADLR